MRKYILGIDISSRDIAFVIQSTTREVIFTQKIIFNKTITLQQKILQLQIFIQKHFLTYLPQLEYVFIERSVYNPQIIYAIIKNGVFELTGVLIHHFISIPHLYLITPNEWKKPLNFGMTFKGSKKLTVKEKAQKSIEFANNLSNQTFIDNDLADAFLIGCGGYEKYK